MVAFKEALYVVLFSFLILLIALIALATQISIYKPSIINQTRLNQDFNSKENVSYYGFSTSGYCSFDSDCFISGCNSEICQSKYEEPKFSICILPDKPTPLQLGYHCGCVLNKCQWIRS